MKTKYVNIRVRGASTQEPKQASYNETSTSAVLDKSNDWMVSISRFYLTTTRLPIYLMETINPSDTNYKYAVALHYVSTNTTVSVPIDSYIAARARDSVGGRLAVSSYDDILLAINDAYSTALFMLRAQIGTNLPPNFPTTGVKFQRTTDNRIQILIHTAYNLQAILVGFNNALMNKLGPISLTSMASNYYIDDSGLNSIAIGSDTYTVVTEPGSSLVNWNTIKQVVFKSSIPVEPELRSGQSRVQDQILTDFNVTGIIDHTPLSFYPEGPLRKYNLLSTDPLRTIDLKVFWRDIDGQDYPWLLYADDLVSCKLRFDSV